MQKGKFLAPILLCAALVAGCGGGGGSAKLGGGDVAVVGNVHISQTQYDALIEQAKRSFQQQGRKFPQQGTTDYETL